jgi:hypothetical protein
MAGLFTNVIKRLAQQALKTIASAVSYVPGGQAVVSYVSRHFGGLSQPESQQLADVGYQYERAGNIQTYTAPNVSIDPADVPIDPTLIGRIPPGNTVQYYLSGRVLNPYTGQAKWVSTIINWPDFLTGADLQRLGAAALLDIIKNYPVFQGMPEGATPDVIELVIKGVSKTG